MLSTTVYAKVRELNLAQGWNQKLTPLPNQTYVLNCMNISASLMVGDDILQQGCKFYNPCHACSRLNACLRSYIPIVTQRRIYDFLVTDSMSPMSVQHWGA